MSDSVYKILYEPSKLIKMNKLQAPNHLLSSLCFYMWSGKNNGCTESVVYVIEWSSLAHMKRAKKTQAM